MITNSFSASYRFWRSASLFIVLACHFLIAVFFIRSARLENTVPAYALMNIFSVRQDATEKSKVSIEKSDSKIARQFQELESRALKTNVDEPSKLIEAINAEHSLAEQTKGEGNPISNKDLASLDSVARRYNLDVPKAPLADTLTPAQQAAQDPRSNSARLTKSEKFAVALGNLDCIFQIRLANGKVIRVPGQWVVAPARSEPGMKTLATARFCVRAHQEADEDGNDLTAISAGIKGKL